MICELFGVMTWTILTGSIFTFFFCLNFIEWFYNPIKFTMIGEGSTIILFVSASCFV